ncbi:unnamed protein product, partial [Timema podura]|nr:unnamed protein product [Timema podura]
MTLVCSCRWENPGLWFPHIHRDNEGTAVTRRGNRAAQETGGEVKGRNAQGGEQRRYRQDV